MRLFQKTTDFFAIHGSWQKIRDEISFFLPPGPFSDFRFIPTRKFLI